MWGAGECEVQESVGCRIMWGAGECGAQESVGCRRVWGAGECGVQGAGRKCPDAKALGATATNDKYPLVIKAHWPLAKQCCISHHPAGVWGWE